MDNTITNLETRILELIELTEELSRENRTLRNDHQVLRQEFDALREKNKTALARIEKIVARLGSME